MKERDEKLVVENMNHGDDRKNGIYKKLQLWPWLLFVMLGAGCLVHLNPISRMNLDQRVHLYWTMRLDRQFDRKWHGHQVSLYSDLLNPELRQHITKDEFYQRFNFQVLEFNIDQIERTSKTTAKVTAHINLRVKQGYELKHVPVVEEWKLKDGVWYWSPRLREGPFWTPKATEESQ